VRIQLIWCSRWDHRTFICIPSHGRGLYRIGGEGWRRLCEWISSFFRNLQIFLASDEIIQVDWRWIINWLKASCLPDSLISELFVARLLSKFCFTHCISDQTFFLSLVPNPNQRSIGVKGCHVGSRLSSHSNSVKRVWGETSISYLYTTPCFVALSFIPVTFS